MLFGILFEFMIVLFRLSIIFACGSDEALCGTGI
jgi:hypothetical protein